MPPRPANEDALADLADVLRRALDEVALCRRIITQARDQLVAVEIALSREREGVGV